jgi:hypothetical protein
MRRRAAHRHRVTGTVSVLCVGTAGCNYRIQMDLKQAIGAVVGGGLGFLAYRFSTSSATPRGIETSQYFDKKDIFRAFEGGFPALRDGFIAHLAKQPGLDTTEVSSRIKRMIDYSCVGGTYQHPAVSLWLLDVGLLGSA